MIASRRVALTLGMAAGLVLLDAIAATARAEDPALAPGRDPAGTAVAVLADGFDYTAPDIAAVLARDGEGEAIAWDAVDDDPRPFARDGNGTGIARRLAASGHVRIVPIRVAAGDAASLAKAVSFAEATPARIVLATFAAGTRTGRDVLAAAAQRFARTLFVGAAPDLAPEETTHADTIGNLVLIDTRADEMAAADRLARAFGCGQTATGTTGAELKKMLLERTQGSAPAACNPKSDAKPD